MGKTCSACGETIHKTEIEWPDANDRVLCQMCWEKECSNSLWEMAAQLGMCQNVVVYKIENMSHKLF